MEIHVQICLISISYPFMIFNYDKDHIFHLIGHLVF